MNIYIYTGEACHACDATKRALLKAGHTYIATAATAEHRERFRAAGHRSLPVVVITNDAGETIDEWSGFRPDKIEALEVPT